MINVFFWLRLTYPLVQGICMWFNNLVGLGVLISFSSFSSISIHYKFYVGYFLTFDYGLTTCFTSSYEFLILIVSLNTYKRFSFYYTSLAFFFTYLYSALMETVWLNYTNAYNIHIQSAIIGFLNLLTLITIYAFYLSMKKIDP